MPDPRSVLLIGGPDAGKTNYLIRLWLAMKARNSQLAADKIAADIEYLEDGVNSLITGTFVPRNSTDVPHRTLEIPFKTESISNGSGVLVLPDYSGEEWRQIYERRSWPAHWENLINGSAGCLLFIRVDSDQIVPALDWITWPISIDDGTVAPLIATTDVRVTPTQVVLVDWLQCLRQAFTGRVNGRFRPRIGIVVTAWDLVPFDQQNQLPLDYIQANYPLLGQYIMCNQDAFDFSVFAVSITGGDLDNDLDFRARYLRDGPNHAGYTVVNVDEHPVRLGDVTIPVIWALGSDPS